jgi:hypothetical protein
MKSRHGQWLIVIKKSDKTEPAKALKAASGNKSEQNRNPDQNLENPKTQNPTRTPKTLKP